jgi:hypothetical protein
MLGIRLYGAITSYVLKPRVDRNTLIGDCFVPRLMLEEVMSWNAVDGWFEPR